MDVIRKMAYKFDPIDEITKALEKWAPKKLEAEKAYELDLYEYLHKVFDDPSIAIEKQSGRGKVKADIRILGEAIIELKFNLQSIGQFNTLNGQLEEYLSWKAGKIFVVLLGKTEPSLRKKLLQKSKGGFLDEDYKFIVIEK